METDKPTKKRVYYNEVIITILVNKYGFSVDYIRKCIRGDRQGIMPDRIASEYKALDFEASKAVQQKAIPKSD